MMGNTYHKTLHLPEGFLIGHASDYEAGTGCSVILCKDGAVASCAVRGSAPATIETDLLAASKTVQAINAVLLSGGSAFGLVAAAGVMQWLEEHGCGFAVGDKVVPIVCGAAIFDLALGSGEIRPDKHMGYLACVDASNQSGAELCSGNIGGGTGASVGKLLGMDYAMKSGFGASSIEDDKLVVCAVVVCNAVGNVVKGLGIKNILAGVRNPQDLKQLMPGLSALAYALKPQTSCGSDPVASCTDWDTGASRGAGVGCGAGAGANTTIGCIITNAKMTKAEAARIAEVTHDAYGRTIDPAHTSMDGDAVFVMSNSTIEAHTDLVGAYAMEAMVAAIFNSVESAKAAYGLPGANK